MKKLTSRSYMTLLLAFLIIACTGLYIFKLARYGSEWAAFSANESVYSDGVLNTGTLTDCNGIVLAQPSDNGYTFSESEAIRVACLHTVGDLDGNIGTGALNLFRSDLVGYSIVSGTSGSGGTVRLSIDSSLNVTAYNALAGRKGAVLVYNYETGEILCMVSSPSYDPLYGFDEENASYEGAYINRCISSTFIPGSIFKIVTLAAAIENNYDLLDTSFYCEGYTDIGVDTVTCSGVHGWQDLYDAFANSCNCAFAELSLDLGGDIIQTYAEKYGLTQSHLLNGMETAAGSVESGGSDNANVAWEGIGQYNDMISPYAMLRLVGAIANGGYCVEPTLLAGDTSTSSLLVNPSTASTISSMMKYNAENGYGSAWRFEGLDIAAKTGTAETGDGTSHAWFAGFLTDVFHPYAFVVLVENAGDGLTNAGEVANTVLQQAVYGY